MLVVFNSYIHSFSYRYPLLFSCDNFSYHKKTVVFDVFLLYNIYRGVTYENDKSK